MEIRELRSFLAVASAGSMTHAAEELHVTQPTLSKQIKALETELGKKLFVRRGFGISLTEAGELLRERAHDLVGMADKIESEFTELDNITGGVLYFGMAETHQVKYIARQIAQLRESCPDLHYHVESGVSGHVLEHLDKGIVDFAVLAERPDRVRYEFVLFPEHERWGLIMRDDDELSRREAITADDLVGLPLFCSEQAWREDIPHWARHNMSKLRHEATFGLPYNGAVFVREGLGYLLALDQIIDTRPGSGLVFRPLDPPLETGIYLTWKRNRPLTPIAERFLRQTQRAFAEIDAAI